MKTGQAEKQKEGKEPVELAQRFQTTGTTRHPDVISVAKGCCRPGSAGQAFQCSREIVGGTIRSPVSSPGFGGAQGALSSSLVGPGAVGSFQGGGGGRRFAG